MQQAIAYDPCAKLIGKQLKRFLSNQQRVIAQNIFILGSPWECDLVTVSKAMFFTEYEIKISISDYRNDFEKRTHRFGDGGEKKHDVYASDNAVTFRRETIPKPGRFFFVTPKGLLDGVEIPSHCGHIEFDASEKLNYRKFQTAKKAPRLKKPTKLDLRELHNIAIKISQAY